MSESEPRRAEAPSRCERCGRSLDIRLLTKGTHKMWACRDCRIEWRDRKAAAIQSAWWSYANAAATDEA
jgi:ribosomal protein L37AE/L43A